MKIYTSTGNLTSAPCFPACCSNLLAIRIVNDVLLKLLHFFTLHVAMHIGNWFWLHVYWNWLPGKICIYFTNIDVISSKLYCLQNFVWTNQTIINFILAFLHVLINIDSSVKILQTFLQLSLTVPIAKWLERHAGKQGVAGSIPGGGTYFHFELCASHFSQLGENHTQQKVQRTFTILKTGVKRTL